MFNLQLPQLKAAYMAWSLGLGEEGLTAEFKLPTGADVQGTYSLTVVDVFCAFI